jgi:hypothetical protein
MNEELFDNMPAVLQVAVPLELDGNEDPWSQEGEPVIFIGDARKPLVMDDTYIYLNYHKGTSPITSLAEHVKALLDCREETERTYEQAYDFAFKSGPHREHWNALAALTNWTPKPEEEL